MDPFSMEIVLPTCRKGFRKKLAPYGSKFFPFRVDPFQKGLGVQESKQEVTKVISLAKMAENLLRASNSLIIPVSNLLTMML